MGDAPPDSAGAARGKIRAPPILMCAVPWNHLGRLAPLHPKASQSETNQRGPAQPNMVRHRVARRDFLVASHGLYVAYATFCSARKRGGIPFSARIRRSRTHGHEVDLCALAARRVLHGDAGHEEPPFGRRARRGTLNCRWKRREETAVDSGRGIKHRRRIARQRWLRARIEARDAMRMTAAPTFPSISPLSG